MQKLKLLILFSLLCINSHARKPAVEPIMGSSIEEYQEVDPKDAKGYNFTRQADNEVFEKNAKEIYPPVEITTQSLDESNGPTQMIVLLFIILPVIASGFLFFKSFGKDESNVVSLDEIKKRKSQNNDEDDNIPKAS